MPKYTVLADGHTEVVRGKDPLTDEPFRRYVPRNKGDEVEMSEDDAQRLVDAGGLILSSEVKNAGDGEATQVDQGLVSAATPQNPHTDPEQTLPAGVSGQTADEGLRGTATSEDESSDGDSEPPAEPVKFEDLAYPLLQAAARDRGLPATGTKDDLVERLNGFVAGQE